MTNELSTWIKILTKAPIRKNYCLILGAGKFGEVGLSYAQTQNFPLILMIDKERTSLVKKLTQISGFSEYSKIFNQSGSYFYQSDIETVSELFLLGFPEFFIPAVPLHAVAYILVKILVSTGLKVETKITGNMWKKLLQTIPSEVLLSHNYDNGIILLSWAKGNEICPDNCPSPLNYCSYHHRNKPYPITKLAENMKIENLHNYVIESHQVKAGLGMVHGKELKLMMLECLSTIQNELMTKENSSFMISTTCNCHGVANCFTCSSF